MTTLPPEARAELKRIRRKHRARALAADALLAMLIQQLLYPPREPAPEEISIDRYLSGR